MNVIDTPNPGAAGVPLSKTIVRYLAMMIGAAPAFALLVCQRIAVGGTADAMFTTASSNGLAMRLCWVAYGRWCSSSRSP